MADTTITTNGNGDKDKEQKKLMRLELAALRQQVRFLELLAAEKKIGYLQNYVENASAMSGRGKLSRC